MEGFLLLMNSVMDSWMSPSTMDIAMDMSFGIVCGMGLFFILLPFLKKYPLSPPPESQRDIPQDVKRRQSNTRKKTAAVTDYRDCKKNAQDTQNASSSMESLTKLPLRDSTAKPTWNSTKKLDQLSISQLLSYLKVLEELIQQKFCQIFCGISSVLPQSVVTTAWVSRKPPSVETKTSPFRNSYSPYPALPLAPGPPQLSQDQPLTHQWATSRLLCVAETRVVNRYPSSTTKNPPSSSKSRAYEPTCSQPGMKALTSLQTENQGQQKDLKWKHTTGSNASSQDAIRQSTGSFPWGTVLTEVIRSASLVPEHYWMVQDHEKQKKHQVSKVGDHQGPGFEELKSPEGHFSANSPQQSKNELEPSQPAPPSTPDSGTYKSSHMMESVPSRLPLKKRPVNRQDSIQEGLLPCTPSSSPGNKLETEKPALRTDQLSYVNTAQALSFLDSKTQMELESNILEHRKRSDLHSRDLQSGVPPSHLPQPGYPSSASCVSKAERFPKAAVVLEKLQHQDPGGTRLKRVSVSRRLQNTPLVHSSSEVQENQRASSPGASYGHSEPERAALQSTTNTWANTYCLLARTQDRRTIWGTGRGSLQPRTSFRIVRQVPCKRSENVASGHPFSRGTMVDPEVKAPSSVAKQTNRIVDARRETPNPWKETLGPNKIPSGQNKINFRAFESTRANINPGQYFQTCPPHPRGPPLKPQVISEVDSTSDKQPLSPTARLHVHTDMVIYPSLPSYQNRSKDPKTLEGLRDVFMRKTHAQETQHLRISKDKILGSNHKMVLPNEEKGDFVTSRSKGQKERPRGVQSSQGSDTSTQPKVIVIPECHSNMPENEQDNIKSFLTKIKNNLQYVNPDTEDKGQGDSVKNESPPPSTLPNQAKEKFISSMETQSLLNAVVQILVDTLGLKIKDPSKIEWCEVEQLLSQLEASSHSSQRACDPKTSQPKRMSCDYTNPIGHSHPIMYRGTGGKQELSVNAQRAHDQYQNRGMGFDQHSTLTEKNQLFRYREIGDKQQTSLAAQTACDQDQIRAQTGKEPCLYSSPKGYNHSIKCRENEEKQQPVVDHKAFNPRQRTKEGMRCGYLTGPKENSPIKYRESRDQKQSGNDAQGASDRKTCQNRSKAAFVPQ
ncbi:uncharacterized protein LOC134482685 [Rattus norvegicus]|uniref:uncharacterized protein LOC134482685 n=1 Tax=Rattus norvegicus TaxID=10116 RepID=UPI0000DA3F92|eukprot:XP_006253797.1 PREDICTED: uncharacterized protein LOC689587 isoform X2 [Rattus norvegicus]